MLRRSTLVLAGLAISFGSAYALGRALGPDEPPERRDEHVRAFLEPWYDAFRRHDEHPAEIVVVGDSISEGVLLDAPVHRHRMVGLLQERLREAAGTTGGAGYLPAYYADWFTPEDTVRSGTPPQEAPFEKWGLGGRALLMPQGAQLTYPRLPASRVRVWFGRTSWLGGAAKVWVDGADVTAEGTLSTGERSAGTIEGAVATGTTSGLWWESGPLGSGEHEVRVASTRPETVFTHTGVEFLLGDDDVEAGIRIYDASHAGATATDFAGEQMVAGHWRDVAAVDPDLVLVNLGSNPDPAYRAGLTSVVEHALEAAPRAQVLLVDGYRPGAWDRRKWQEVRDARAAVAARFPDRVAVFDLAAHWPTLRADGSTSRGLMVEDTLPLHPNALGNKRMAEIFAELLTPHGA